MASTCQGCDAEVKESDELVITCSLEMCGKSYHVKCLNWTSEKFESLSEDSKRSWLCPECMCSLPKVGNLDTTICDKSFSSASKVNIQRGSNYRNIGDKLIAEIREFRQEVKSRMDDQAKEYLMLQNKFQMVECELKDLKSTIKTLQERSNKVEALEEKLTSVEGRNEYLENRLKEVNKEGAKPLVESAEKPEILAKSYAKAASKNIKKVVAKKSVPTTTLSETESATNPTASKQTQEIAPRSLEINKDNTTKENEGEWETQTRKRNRYPNGGEVKKGSGKTELEIQGTEKNRYLHIWRLKIDTTQESVEKYVRKIYEDDTPIKVEKIKHKTQRDYASFIIGIPESKYDKLCEPENWAVNIEYCEWIWFRRSASQPKSQ